MNTPHPSDPPVARPNRPFPWVTLRRVSLGIGTVLLGVATFYGIENLTGWRRWSVERAAVARNHTPLELAEIIPPAVPDDQNLARTEPFPGLFSRNRGPDGHVSDIDPVAQTWCSLYSVNGLSSRRPSLGHWADTDEHAHERTLPLAEWQNFFREPPRLSMKNVVEARRRLGLPVPSKDSEGASAPAYPVPAVAGPPHEDVLRALTVFDAQMAVVTEGTRLPHANFPIAYEDGPAALLPHLAKVKELTMVFTLRAVARLESGDPEGAFDDLTVALALAESPKEEPLLISQLVRYACLQIALQSLWEGQVHHRWSEPQLRMIQDRLAAIDMNPGLRRALADERIMMTGITRTILGSARGRREMASMLDLMAPNSGNFQDPSNFHELYLFWAPRGWLHASTAEISRAIRVLETTAPKDVLALAPNWPPQPPQGPLRYQYYRAYLRPEGDKALIKFVLKSHRAQAQARLAQTACALERHRLAEGHYPDRLEALVPRWLAAPPVDPIDLQPLRYTRVGDDRFLLWSVAENGKDDAGSMVPDSNLPLRSPDWAWTWP
ncbi:MAG: hypothetical protein AB7O66_03920 [Limisphaerales bacterium]